MHSVDGYVCTRIHVFVYVYVWHKLYTNKGHWYLNFLFKVELDNTTIKNTVSTSPKILYNV